ncbi:MAG: alpha-amylase family glycosyl hydrolase [Bacteroidetes bacterium]|nr:alpha-amylase family glycosyl hydrolase [Bacteroidota bacterium]
MKTLLSNPVIYEINTLVWLEEISRQSQADITLANVPDYKWDEISQLKIQAVWLMGVWERSPECIKISNADPGNLSEFKRALSDFTLDDNTGSPYSVRNYKVDQKLGGNHGLAIAREKLSERNIALLLDFVPNHLAFDHPWVDSNPEFFIHGTVEDLAKDPVTFKCYGSDIFACGKDPYYPAWEDVVQVNAFNPLLRLEVTRVLRDIASMCDGVRCDMAMLMLNSVFLKTWGSLAGEALSEEYWMYVISEVKKEFPDFIFIAEVYWDMEYILQQNGFDYCYDKRLYDRLKGEDAESIRDHLQAPLSYQSKLIRFIENHDEDRAISIFNPDKEKAAALISLSLPGAKLIHEGQLEGRVIRLPVFLRRRPEETLNAFVRNFYENILEITAMAELHKGEWMLCPVSGWDDNQSCRHILSWYWKYENKICLIAVNYCPNPSQGFVLIPDCELAGHDWRLVDLFTQAHFIRNGDELAVSGLYVGLESWGFHLFQMYRMV